VSTRTFTELARRLGPLPPAAIELLGVSRSRSDTIAAGAAVIATVLEQLGGPVVYVARSALREGALIDYARKHRSSLRKAG
jgi:exopolyphosphatase/pppGpp-phosphohydrolase